MINRELIRIKVVQLTYAYYQNGSNNMANAEKELLYSLSKGYDLYNYLLMLIGAVTKEEDRRAQIAAQRAEREGLPMPNMKFVENRFAKQLEENDMLIDFREKQKMTWDDHLEFVRKLCNQIEMSPIYQEYMASEDDSYDADREVWRKIYKTLVQDNTELESVLEEKSLYWNDDKEVVDTFVLKTIKRFDEKNGAAQELLPEFKDLEDKEFARKRALELLELVGITDAEKRMKNYPHQLSGGMRQRVVIAIALSSDPDVLICDEPTTALDVTIQARILELIRDVQSRLGLSVIYITHDLGVVAKVADYVNVMYAGKIIEVGTVNEIFYEPKHPYTWGLLAAMPDLETDDDRLVSIPGSPPNLLHEPVGDAFAPRNALALKIDEKADPPMFKVSETHYAATWLLHPDAPKVEMPHELQERIERSRKEAEQYL